MSRSVVLRVLVAIVAMLMVTAAGLAVTGERKAADSTVVGYFTDASPLEVGNQVRAAGVRAGSVREIALEHGHARVTFDVEPWATPLHRDARLRIRPVDVLGEHYVELDRGSPSQPFMDEAVVPVKRTSKTVDLQEVLNTFDDPTSTALAALLTTLGEGLHDSGGEAEAAIKALAPAMRRAGELGSVLNSQNDVLTHLLDRVQPVAKALAGNKGETLDRLVGNTEKMMSTLAINQQALDETLVHLPETVDAARRSLRELAGVSEASIPTLRSVRPITGDLTEITGELQRFADAADPALASLKPVLERADELLKQAAPAVAQLRRAGPDVRAVAKDLRPLGEELLHDHLGDLMAFVKKWSLSTNGRDALGHYFRAKVYITPKTLQDLAKSALGTPDKVGDAAKSPIDLPKLPDALPKIDPGNVTGLTPKQEQSMLDQLLGGL